MGYQGMRMRTEAQRLWRQEDSPYYHLDDKEVHDQYASRDWNILS